MGKLKLTAVVATDVEGVATVSDAQQDSYNATPIEYTAGRGYFIPVQKAHQVSVSYQGEEYKSKRVFAVEMMKNDKGNWESTGNLTAIKLSNIRQTYFAEVKEGVPAPEIPTFTNNEGKRKMVTDGVDFLRAVKGSNGLGCKDNTPFVKYPVLFVAAGQIHGYTPHFEDNALQAGEDDNLMLDDTVINTFISEPAPSAITYTLGDIVDLSDERYSALAV